jgi:hypothetical protein
MNANLVTEKGRLKSLYSTQTVTTQTNHFLAALCAFVKLEVLSTSTKLNHFTKPSCMSPHYSPPSISFVSFSQLPSLRKVSVIRSL